MCRVFGFKSVISSQVHTSLTESENALAIQSKEHPHGWGVAYYVAGAPHLIKNVDSAVESNLFKRVSGVVSSNTVVAHIRKATLGVNSIVNTHPFQYGPWVFAHNGHIHEFEKYKEDLLNLVAPNLRRFVLGETDSELIFYVILSELYTHYSILDRPSVSQMSKVLDLALERICNLIGDFSEEDTSSLECNYLTFVITNGDVILAHQGGKRLYYSTYKNRCSDRDTCSSFSQSCEAESEDGQVNHMIFSSEPLSGENVWLELENGELMGVDNHMKIFRRDKK
ncbi:MAG: class II glutamine amidotransferase [Bdellovibrionota bacterium]